MRIKQIHSNFIMPTKGTDKAGGFDIYMPQSGTTTGDKCLVGLGFAAEVPDGHVAFILPRSGIGSKYGLELNNTCGVIDSDYTGEWKASIRTKSGMPFTWDAGDRLLQFVVIPIASVALEKVESLDETFRGTRGFGSTGT